MDEQNDGLVVIGEGVAATPVDSVVLTLNLVDLRPSAAQAFQAVGQTSTRVLAMLADDGVDARRVRTQDLTLGPQTHWANDREIVHGYTASQRLIVRLPGLSGFERLLADVANVGGDSLRIESVRLEPSDPAVALSDARDAAIADARQKGRALRRPGRSAAGSRAVDPRGRRQQQQRLDGAEADDPGRLERGADSGR